MRHTTVNEGCGGVRQQPGSNFVTDAESKLGKNVYRSEEQVIFQLYSLTSTE